MEESTASTVTPGTLTALTPVRATTARPEGTFPVGAADAVGATATIADNNKVGAVSAVRTVAERRFFRDAGTRTSTS
jgi:hypothetical protein